MNDLFRNAVVCQVMLVLMCVALGCDVQQKPDDCPQGIRVKRIVDPVTLVSNEHFTSGSKSAIAAEWNSNLGGLRSVGLDLSQNGTFYWTGTSYNDVLVADGSCTPATLQWNGLMLNPSGRPYLPYPGNSAIRLRILCGNCPMSESFEVVINPNPWDDDGDNISNAVEIENNKIDGVAQTPITDEDGQVHYGWYSTLSIDFPRQIPLSVPTTNILYANRLLHDYSISVGVRTSGSLYNGLRLAHSSTGYRYWHNIDPVDTDNWGTLELINLIEAVAREWSYSHPNYPLTTGDMSLASGGTFGEHKAHQLGRSLDIYYVGTRTYDEVIFENDKVLITDADYDANMNYDLMQLFITMGNVYQIYTSDQLLYDLAPDDKIVYWANHDNHFHVELN